jgi:hypothetical protein
MGVTSSEFGVGGQFGVRTLNSELYDSELRTFLRRQLLGLLYRALNSTDHMERLLRQVVVLAFH